MSCNVQNILIPETISGQKILASLALKMYLTIEDETSAQQQL